jgi:hypothetical protein
MSLIKPGATVILAVQPSFQCTTGDIVAYIGSSGSITIHRIIALTTGLSGHTHCLLKGDNNRASDGYIDTQYILGRALKIMYPTYTIDLTTPLSSYIARLIACCGRATFLNQQVYILERIVVLCLIRVTTVYAQSCLLLCGKIPRGGTLKSTG